MCTSPIEFRRARLLYSIHSGSYILSAASSARHPEPWLEEYDGDMSFMTKCSLHNSGLWVCISLHWLQEKGCLIMTEQGTDL